MRDTKRGSHEYWCIEEKRCLIDSIIVEITIWRIYALVKPLGERNISPYALYYYQVRLNS